MSLFRTIIVFFSIIGCSLSIWVTVPQKTINVTVGQTVNLQCSFTTDVPMNNLLVQWTLYPRSSLVAEEVLYFQSGQKLIGQQFQNRLTILSAMNVTKNASISISNMQSADAGSYTCDVRNYPDISGKAEASVMVNVLEKPSTPVCAVHGDVSTGHLVTLTCHSSTGTPSPKYNWTRLEQGMKKNVLGFANVNTGTLYIRNISQFEFGTYQCNASNVVGFSSCTVNLNSEMNSATIVGAVIGALLGVAFIMLLVWFITHKLKKQKYTAAKTNQASMTQNYEAATSQNSDQEMELKA